MPKRYTMSGDRMFPSQVGDWVYFPDHEARLARVERLAAMLRDPRQWIQNEWTTRISQELDAALRPADSAPAVEHYDAIWRTVPMPLDYTCYCGLYVHPTKRNPEAIHISDCPYASTDNTPGEKP